jgi:membrane protease YdiL (CAAX protease family)
MEIQTSNPLVPVGLILFLLLNVLGQQLFWKGYVFPRQELAFGNSTWIIHGLLWTITLSFLIWDIAFILFVSLTLSYTVQRVKSTWPALIAHAATLIVIFWIHPLFLPN